ncbi:glutathione S-transferase family protein [Shinella sp. WSJ-2]|uniref:glutathione S-transferase family protein n=1 Tax=Shinella sp. WSJ-2 TaxID=2303749 RepID=UPI000E3B8494|nr:glutathione S-transferase family protein [Shinella sp. WSJ-2]RFZ86649.1 glutathione S-transferase family protein [Shinella sp. WSJ-2]
MRSSVIVYGAAYSVYVRIVRITLQEKGVAYDLVPVDVFAEHGVPADHFVRHPFGRIPSFEHDGFSLYETSAITRYVDEAFPGPALQPVELRERARMNQIIAMLDNYAYLPMVWDVYVQRVEPREGERLDEARIASGLHKVRAFIIALSDMLGGQQWLAGSRPSLADFHAVPMFDLFEKAPEGAALIAAFPQIEAWLGRMKTRPSYLMT